MKEFEIEHTKNWVKESIDLALKNKGTFYLPYQQFATKEQFEKAYPKELCLSQLCFKVV